MKVIEVYGMGSSDIDSMTVGTLNALKEKDTVYARTVEHPAVEALVEMGVSIVGFDHLYEENEAFEAVYEKIKDELLALSMTETVTYLVPGHPLFYETTTELLLKSQDDMDVSIEVKGGSSFIDAVISSLQVPINTHFQVLDASTMTSDDLNHNAHTLITQVYDQMSLSDAKLTLMEYYPDEMEVYLVEAAGSQNESVLKVKLYEIDHGTTLSNMLALYIPKLDSEDVRHRTIGYMNMLFDTLVDEEKGCPWDKRQTHKSLEKYLIEESYEFIEAVENEDDDAIVEELGDVLLQVALHSAIGKKNGYFDFYDVLKSLNDKVVRRHPHIFGDEEVVDIDGLDRVWKREKAKEGKVEKVKHEKEYSEIILPWMAETISTGKPLKEILDELR